MATTIVGGRLAIGEQFDVELIRRAARCLAFALHFDHADAEVVALAASELASNLVRYATRGTIEVIPLRGPRGAGVEIESIDHGPGIVDVAAALRDGFSTAGGLGVGLGGVRRLMDEFDLISGPTGTRVVCRKWRHKT